MAQISNLRNTSWRSRWNSEIRSRRGGTSWSFTLDLTFIRCDRRVFTFITWMLWLNPLFQVYVTIFMNVLFNFCLYFSWCMCGQKKPALFMRRALVWKHRVAATIETPCAACVERRRENTANNYNLECILHLLILFMWFKVSVNMRWSVYKWDEHNFTHTTT